MAICVELKEGSENISYSHCNGGGCYVILFAIILSNNNREVRRKVLKSQRWPCERWGPRAGSQSIPNLDAVRKKGKSSRSSDKRMGKGTRWKGLV